jgi:hypothetical protein
MGRSDHQGFLFGGEKMTDLQKAITALEEAGFHMDRAYEENNRDAGNPGYQEAKTGAICLRITPRPSTASEACHPFGGEA